MARGKIEKRGQRRRKIKPVILIVTEGSQTEPKYFEHYRNRQTNIDIRVVGSLPQPDPESRGISEQKSDFRIRGRLCMGSCRWRCELQQP